MNADVRELLRRAQGKGWELLPTRGGHYRLHFPATGAVVVVPATPSDNRSLRNVEALITRVSGRMSPGKGHTSKAERQRRRERERSRAARRRAAAPVEPLRPARTAMEVAFDDYLTTRAPDHSTPEQRRDVG